METPDPLEVDVIVLSEDGAQVARAQGGFQTTPGEDTEIGESMLVPLALDLRGAACLSREATRSRSVWTAHTSGRSVSWAQPRPERQATSEP